MTDRDTITRTRARAPGVGGVSTAWRCSIASTDPTLGGSTLKHEGRRQTDRRAAYAGSRLKLIDASGRSRLIRQPFSRNGENSPYGSASRKNWCVQQETSLPGQKSGAL